MQDLIDKHLKKVNQVSTSFQRYLLHQINWNNRLIAIKGARGSGKTTLLLQYLKLKVDKKIRSLYISMDDLYFTDHRLYDLAKEFSNLGGEILLLDEVHKYPNWSREIKLIYDDFNELNIVFTSSSILDIYKGESDLSRRAITYTLKELSLREYIALKYKIQFESYSLKNILLHHQEIAPLIVKEIKPLAMFNEYNNYGVYPYFMEGKEEYEQRLFQTINLIIEVDMMASLSLTFETLNKTKKLLRTVATSVPFTPNITRLSEKLNISRPTLIQSLYILEKARLIILLKKAKKGIGHLTKPEKIYVNNTNILKTYAAENWNLGTIRETFFANQLNDIHNINIGQKADFEVDLTYNFEIGGKNKTKKQIQNLPNSYIVKDNIEFGIDNIIPLWLFGFLY